MAKKRQKNGIPFCQGEKLFLRIGRDSIRARFFSLREKQDKHFFILWEFLVTTKFTFSTGNFVLYEKNGHQHSMHFIYHHLGWQKNAFSLARRILAFCLFLGFFWPKNSQKQPSGPNNPAEAKKNFCPSSCWYVVHFTLIYTICSKVSFLHQIYMEV